MSQYIWKGMPIIGTCGGRETIFPTSETSSKMIFLKGFKESQKMNFSEILPDYNKKKASRNSHISGNPCPHEYLGYLKKYDSKPI